MLALVLVAAACGGTPPSASSLPSAETSPGLLADTWVWDGSQWRPAHVPGPSPREAAALAFDAARGVYLLFGGQSNSGQLGDTWSWDGSMWRQLSPAHHPSPRRGSAMAYDPIHRAVVLYGGLAQDSLEGHEVGDTWTWDGNDWTQVGEGP